MNRAAIWLVALVLLGGISPAAASLLPSFVLDYSAWHATDIVVVDATGPVPGRAKVLEGWKGGLRAGEVLDVPGLEALAPEEVRTVHAANIGEQPAPQPPVYVTGSKIVLFLDRGTGTLPDWQPAGTGEELKVCAVWIEGDKAYSFQQVVRPGPCELREMAQSAAALKSEVQQTVSTQNTLSEIDRMEDSAPRARALAPFVVSDQRYVREDAFEKLAGCGPAALPALRAMLKDEKLLPLHREVVKAMGEAGGADVGAELVQILRGETGFWKQTAPTLQAGWWNGKGLAGWPEIEALRDRYCQTQATVQALAGIEYHGDMGAVAELRDYWASLPQLNDKSGLDEIVKECDRLLQPADTAGH